MSIPDQRPAKICLLTTNHIGSNPRLVKEADALTAAGFNVRVVAVDVTPSVKALDTSILEKAGWQCTLIGRGGTVSWRVWSGIRVIARQLYQYSLASTPRVMNMAWSPFVNRLGVAAAAQPADLYIAHTLAALPAAHHAAGRHNARLGFDAEDFHSGELPDTPQNALSIALARDLESRYLPHCDYITAASPGIARAYAELYGVSLPVVTLNVFPKSEAPASVTDKGTATPSPSLYWFSQTIGPDRGLETVVQAIGMSRSRPTLFLRGHPMPGYVDSLNALAKRHGVAGLLRYLPTALPGEMVRLASEYDIGLATEVSNNQNRDICLTNKLFTYLLAGVPVLASATAAQAEIAPLMPGAVFIYPQHGAGELAAAMDTLLLSPGALAAARRAAWTLAQERYNWDVERAVFLQVVCTALHRPPD